MAEYINYCLDNRAGHGTSTEDGLLHFFGCLRFSQRDDFLQSLPETDKLRLRISAELARIAHLRKIFEKEGLRTETGKLLQSFKTTLFQRLPRRRSYSHLDMQENEPNSQSSKPNPKSLEDEVVLGDLRANVIYFKKKPGGKHPGPYDHPALDDTFPHQRVPLSLLLEDNPKENPLMWKCEDDMIRYFHIPANNMSWVEVKLPDPDIRNSLLILQFQGCYCPILQRAEPDLHGPYRKPPQGEKELKTRMLLRPQFWRVGVGRENPFPFWTVS